jgi:hypothetical protein
MAFLRQLELQRAQFAAAGMHQSALAHRPPPPPPVRTASPLDASSRPAGSPGWSGSRLSLTTAATVSSTSATAAFLSSTSTRITTDCIASTSAATGPLPGGAGRAHPAPAAPWPEPAAGGAGASAIDQVLLDIESARAQAGIGLHVAPDRLEALRLVVLDIVSRWRESSSHSLAAIGILEQELTRCLAGIQRLTGQQQIGGAAGGADCSPGAGRPPAQGMAWDSPRVGRQVNQLTAAVREADDAALRDFFDSLSKGDDPGSSAGFAGNDTLQRALQYAAAMRPAAPALVVEDPGDAPPRRRRTSVKKEFLPTATPSGGQAPMRSATATVVRKSIVAL